MQLEQEVEFEREVGLQQQVVVVMEGKKKNQEEFEREVGLQQQVVVGMEGKTKKQEGEI